MFKTKLLVLLTVFIDVIGMGIVIPVLPFYVQTFSNSAFTITLLFSIYALCSFVSTPFIGTLSDKYGRRPALIASILSTSLGWIIFASAPSLIFLFIGRIIDGLAAGNISVAQSALVDISKTDKERTENLGYIGAIFGIAFIAGPFFGGLLGHFGHTIPFWFVGIMAAINAILTIIFFPETKNPADVSENKSHSLNPFGPIFRAVQNKSLRPSYAAWFLFGLAISGFYSVFALYLERAFGFQELITGFIFTGMGVVIVMNQGVLMRHFWLKHFSEPVLELWLLLVFSIGYLTMSYQDVRVFALGMLMITFCQSVLRVVMNSQIVSAAKISERGEVLGISASIISLSSAISPIVAGFLFEVNFRAPLYFSSLFGVLAFLVIYNFKKIIPTNVSEDIPVISEV